MKITGISFSRYNYNFKTPIKTAREIITNREGFIVKFLTDTGLITFGESAPLPNFGTEYYFEAENSIKKGIGYFSGIDVPESIFSIPSLLDKADLTNTARAAFEQCFLELFIANRSPQLSSINISEDMNITTNALLQISDDESTLKNVIELVNRGFTTIKIKFGFQDFNDDIRIIASIRKQFPELKIRLDLNGSWLRPEAVDNIIRLAEFDIEYIEQPVDDLNDLILLSVMSPVPIAIDESLTNLNLAKKFFRNRNEGYFILKPMKLGGFFNTKKIFDYASQSKTKCIFSSSFETNIGRRMLVLTAAMASGDLAHGLATADFFAADNTTDIFPLNKNKIHFSLEKYSAFLRQQIQ